jgi:ribosomal protein S18 acetylase RimI-like enzyme
VRPFFAATPKEDDMTSINELTIIWGQAQAGEDAHEALLAIDGLGQVVAFLDLYRLPTGELGIDQIEVIPAWRRRGLATLLWRRASAQRPELVLHSWDWTDDGEAWAASL